MVTFVMGVPLGEEPPVNAVRLISVSSAAPYGQDATSNNPSIRPGLQFDANRRPTLRSFELSKDAFEDSWPKLMYLKEREEPLWQ
jgi:hypothetical protein